jgi:transcription antitermination factor NusG
MPILKPEADVFPGELFDLSTEEFPWWVAHVRSRQEKLASREALHREVPFFLPKYEKVTRQEGRKRTSFLPLFPGYLFFRGLYDSRFEMLKTHLCVRIIEVTDQAALNSDLLQIRRLQLAGLPLIAVREVKAGDPIRIAEGPFCGITGIVVKARGKTRLIVSVRFIQRSVCVDLPREAVIPEPTRASRRTASAGISR